MSTINNGGSSQINRGVELLLRKEVKVKNTFSIYFEKLLLFLNRELKIYFNFSFDLRKQK
jgi:hypothetical protein